MNAARAAVWIAIVFAVEALATRAILQRPPASVARALAQPLPVVTNWNGLGALLVVTLAVAAAIAGAAYLRVLVLLRRETAKVPPAAICAALAGAAALAVACAWLMPAIFSSDVYAYAAYGEMLRTGADPYGHELLARSNPLYDAVVWQWGNPPPACVYGPSFVALASAVVAVTAPLGVAATLEGLRVLAALALLACIPLAYAAYAGDARSRLVAAATIGLNPVAIWSAVEGHNDALALAVVLAGFALLRRAPNAGAALVALAGSVKAPGLAAAAPLLFSRRTRAGALAGIAVALIVSLPLLHALVTRVAPAGRYAPQASLQAVFAAWPPLALAISLAACAVLARAGAVRLARGKRDGWAWLALAAWVLVPNPYPWYGLWLLPVAALAPGTRAANVLLLLSFTSLLRYVPDAAGAPNEMQAATMGVVSLLAFLALAWPERDAAVA